MSDHLPDWYDRIELTWPDGMEQPPTPEWLTADWMPCMDCRANAFLRWVPADGWHTVIAHDATCPAFKTIAETQ